MFVMVVVGSFKRVSHLFFAGENTSAFIIIVTFLNKLLIPTELYTFLLLELDRLNLRKSSLI